MSTSELAQPAGKSNPTACSGTVWSSQASHYCFCAPLVLPSCQFILSGEIDLAASVSAVKI